MLVKCIEQAQTNAYYMIYKNSTVVVKVVTNDRIVRSDVRITVTMAACPHCIPTTTSANSPTNNYRFIIN